ncbi:RNA/RNP complex-1-interacting phosphatase [Manis javanica]|nr:RNA/RNP complex-1-interacting phosphatase [Manis javanica]
MSKILSVERHSIEMQKCGNSGLGARLGISQETPPTPLLCHLQPKSSGNTCDPPEWARENSYSGRVFAVTVSKTVYNPPVSVPPVASHSHNLVLMFDHADVSLLPEDQMVATTVTVYIRGANGIVPATAGARDASFPDGPPARGRVQATPPKGGKTIPVGQHLPGTRFFAVKVPLKNSFEENLAPEERFSPLDILNKVPRRE